MQLFWIISSFAAFYIFFHFGRAIARVNSVQVHRPAFPQAPSKPPSDRTHLSLLLSDLPIGVVSFDAKMRLDTFNPAFTQLFALRPDWLISRPRIDALLHELRRQAALPVPKNFESWSNSFKSLRALERGQIWHDTWRLPDGRNLEVQARSYPKGRIGLQFIDLTDAHRREQDLMTEITFLHQSLDVMEHGVALFDTGGALAFTNSAADRIWNTDFACSLSASTFNDLCAVWQSASQPSPFWGDLIQFVKNGQDRSDWTGQVMRLSGKVVDIRITPLSQSAIMCEFWE